MSYSPVGEMGFGDTSKKDNAAASKASAKSAAKNASEDASWAENDKGLNGKSDRAAAKASAADSKLAAKQEAKALEAAEEEETSKLAGANKKVATKLTQAQIQQKAAMMAMGGGYGGKPVAKKKSAKTESVAQPELMENTNRDTETVEATGIDAALSALGPGDKVKKTTYKDFEAENIPKIKEDNPGLKTSQVKEKAFKMWEKSPENPKNQEK